MSYVKNYDVGQIRLDLPTPNYIHELPLLSFGDVHGSVNLSLVFNYGMKAENSNPFNLSAGYKLNLHKRLIIENSVPIKYQDESGKCTELISTGGVYALDDDSFRILRETENTYTVENSDYSREEYDLEGNLIAVYDKYSTLILEYVYLNNRLRCIHYRGELRISLQYDTNNRIKRITCQDITINLVPTEFGWQITHASGVVYTLASADEVNFSVKASATEASEVVSYETRLTKTDWNTLQLTNVIGDDCIDTMTYKFPNDTSLSFKTKYPQVEITDNKGLKTRVQYHADKPLYSYEVFPGEQFQVYRAAVDIYKFIGDVTIYNALSKTGYSAAIGKLRWADGKQLYQSLGNSAVWEYDASFDQSMILQGNYILTGWVKNANSTSYYADAKITISNGAVDDNQEFVVDGVSGDQWYFFAYAFNMTANTITVFHSGNGEVEFKDLRITAIPLRVRTENGNYVSHSESFLLFKQEVIQEEPSQEEERSEEETEEPEIDAGESNEEGINEEEIIEEEIVEEETSDPSINDEEATEEESGEEETIGAETDESEIIKDLVMGGNDYDKYGYTYIPIATAVFSCPGKWDGSAYEYVSYQDLVRYKLNQQKGVHLNEFYCDMGKTILNINPSSEIVVTYHDRDYILSECCLAYVQCTSIEYTDNTHSLVSKYVKKLDSSSGELVESVLDSNYTPISSRTLDANLDVIQTEHEGIVTTYERNKDLITSESVENLYTRTTTYGVDLNGNQTITVVDEFNNTTVYTIDSVWGALKYIRLPDGSMIVDEFDDDMCAKLKRSFHGKEIRSNEFSYSGGNPSGANTERLAYKFYYDKGSLSGITKNAQWVEQHHSTATQVDSYYPSQSDPVYSDSVTFDKYGRLVSVDDELTNTYSYDPYFDKNTGVLEETRDNADSHLAMTEDNLAKRVSRYVYTEKYQSGDYYDYIDKGRLTEVSVTDKADFSKKISTDLFAYDDANRLTAHAHVYDVAEEKYVGEEIAYTKDAVDPLADNTVENYTCKVNGTDVALSQNSFDDFKRVSEKQVTMNGSVFTKNYIYDKTRVKRTEDIAFNKNLGTNRYYYDSMGRIKSIIYSSLEGTDDYRIYEYDQFGQLIKESNEALDKTIVYQYNEVGNIVNVKKYAFCMCSVPKGEYDETTYSYDNAKPDLVKIVNGHSVHYDDLGYPLHHHNNFYDWNKGKLSAISFNVSEPVESACQGCTFSYNALGQRLSKISKFIIGTEDDDRSYTCDIEYSYDYSGRLVRECQVETPNAGDRFTRELIFLYDESGMVGLTYIVNGTLLQTYYYHRNLQGDVIAIYDTDGNKQAEYAYDAFGNCEVLYSGIYDIGHKNPIRYRGYYYDQETGLYYLNARYYSPEWRRFISPDDTGYLDPETPNGLNLYCYCNNDPVNYVDPSGHLGIGLTLLIATGVGLAFGFGIEVAKQVYNDGDWNWDPTTWNWWELGKASLIGAATGFAYGLGGVAGGIIKGSFKALIIAGKALSVSQSVGVLLGTAALTNFTAGIAGYAMHTAGSETESFNVLKAVSEGVGQAGKGVHTFFTGGLFVASGIWKVGLGAKNTIGSMVVRSAGKYVVSFLPNYFFENLF